MASENSDKNTTVLTRLIHNGILIPSAPEHRGLVLAVRGQAVPLAPKQEEMALAWAKKQGTEYVEDGVFVRNFMQDFSAALGIKPPLAPDEVDFGPAYAIVEAERAARAARGEAERKAPAAARTAARAARRFDGLVDIELQVGQQPTPLSRRSARPEPR